MILPPSQAAGARKKIAKSFEEVREKLGPKSKADWMGTFFQYANRVAHLYYVINKLPAHLRFVYFLNAKDVRGPATREE